MDDVTKRVGEQDTHVEQVDVATQRTSIRALAFHMNVGETYSVEGVFSAN